MTSNEDSLEWCSGSCNVLWNYVSSAVHIAMHLNKNLWECHGVRIEQLAWEETAPIQSLYYKLFLPPVLVILGCGRTYNRNRDSHSVQVDPYFYEKRGTKYVDQLLTVIAFCVTSSALMMPQIMSAALKRWQWFCSVSTWKRPRSSSALIILI